MSRPQPGPLRRAVWAARPFVVPAVVGAGVGGVSLLLVPTVTDGVLVGLAVFALALLARTWDRGESHAWLDAPALTRDGVRRNVTSLTWYLAGRDGRVSEAAVRRLRQDAHRRLARRGVHLPLGLAHADHLPPAVRDEARALLGPAWDVLTERGAEMPTVRQVEQCVTVLERLLPESDDGALTVTRPPRPARTAPRDRAPLSPRTTHPTGRTSA